MKFSVDKLKVQLKLVGPRLELVQKKKTSLNISAKNEIADLLDKGKINTARIKVESIIREDFNIESLEILSLCFVLLNTRLLLLKEKVINDQALLAAIRTIIFSAPRCDIKEVTNISKLLQARFGSKFTKAALNNEDEDINKTIYKNYTLKHLDENLVNNYLHEIASTYKIDCELTQNVQKLNISDMNNNNNNNSINDNENITKQPSYAKKLNDTNKNENINNNIQSNINNNNNNNINNKSNNINNNLNSNVMAQPSKKGSININKNIDRNIEANRIDINDSKDVEKILNDKKVFSLWKRFKGIKSDSSDDNINRKKSSRKNNNMSN